MRFRKRWSLRCIFCTFGIPLTFWLGIYILYWELQLSDWPDSQRQPVRIKARKSFKDVDANRKSISKIENSFFKSEDLEDKDGKSDEDYDIGKTQELGRIYNEEDRHKREIGIKYRMVRALNSSHGV